MEGGVPDDLRFHHTRESRIELKDTPVTVSVTVAGFRESRIELKV